MGHDVVSISPICWGGLSRSEPHVAPWRQALATCITLVLAAVSHFVEAADLPVMVVGRDGRGVDEVVVTAEPASPHAGASPTLKPAVMDQKNLAFLPRVLVVPAGTSVEFPNNDSVSHQVYSFSVAKRFQLPLYKGQAHPPITFDRAGLVVLGCNIHDAMIGYIYVTNAPYFGTTEAGGKLHLQGLPAGDYQVAIWSPYISDPPEALTRIVHISSNESATTRLQLSLALRAQPEPKPRRPDWDY